MNTRCVIIIRAGDKVAANAEAKLQLDPKRGERTFSIGLSATGKLPITHYWCSSILSGEKLQRASALADQFPNTDLRAYDADRDPKFPSRVLAVLGLKQISNFPERPWL